MSKYIFNDNTKLIFIKNYYILIENAGSKYKKKLNEDFYTNLYNMKRKKFSFSDEDNIFTKEQLKFLYKSNIIKKLSPIAEKYENTKFEKFQIYLENVFNDANKVDYIEKNRNKKILFIGAGGICTAMIDYFIAAGFNNFGIVDFDLIEITNFNRQFKYNESDIGYYKIDKIKENLNNQYSGLSISTYNKRILSNEDLYQVVDDYKPNFIICAADTPAYIINKSIAEVSRKRNLPCIFGGVGQKYGVVGPLLYTRAAVNNYIKKIETILKRVEGIFPCRGSFGITNSLISNYMARDVILYLMGKNKKVMCLNKECIIDFDRNNIYEKEKY